MNEQIYEINIKRFLQTTGYQLKKLVECVNKINEYQRYEDWRNVKHAEQNASQIVKRIKSDVKEILKIRNQILSTMADKSSSPIVNRIDEELKELKKRLDHQTSEIDSIVAPYYTFEMTNQNYMLESGYAAPDLFSYSLQKNENLAGEKDLCNAYHQLQKDCDDLKVIMQTFSNEIFAQKPTIDAIESNIVQAHGNIEAGAVNIRQALNYKIYSTAVGGAFIGTIIGGPVGFLAGAKLGAVCGVGSGIFGYFVTKRLQQT